MAYPTESMNCVLRVDTRFVGWRMMLIRILKAINGITYKIDEEKGIVQITGSINPKQLIKTLTEIGLHADLSPANYEFREMNLPVRIAYDSGNHGRSANYYGYSPPQQRRTWHPMYEIYPHYSHYNQPYHEPRVQLFPQPPPPPPSGFRSGDPEWCSIM